MSEHDGADYVGHYFEGSSGEDPEVEDQNGYLGWGDCEWEVENLVGVQALNYVRPARQAKQPNKRVLPSPKSPAFQASLRHIPCDVRLLRV